MRVLVSGCAGFLGSTLAPMLLRVGHEVLAVDNFRFGQTPLFECCNHPLFHLLRCDARAIPLEWVQGADFIIPLAALVGAPACDAAPVEARTVNRDAVMRLRTEAGDTPILVPISNSGYGTAGEEVCTEESPLKPVSLYGQLKVELESWLMQKGNAISLRFATLFGPSPRMRTDLLVNDLTLRAVRDGHIRLYEPHFRRNYVHVRDAALAMLHCIAKWDEMKDNIYNCGDTSANMTKEELASAIAEQVGSVTISVGGGSDPDKRDYLVSNEKIEATGWKPRYTLVDGIRGLVKAYQMFPKHFCGNV